MGALSDLKIVECGDFITAPYCGKLLAELGAEVIKVERPGIGDCARACGPFAGGLPDPEKSGLFLYLNAAKLGITLDFTTASGANIFRRLVGEADILVEDTPPGYLASLGLGWEDLRKINPRLVMTAITPFGQTGPYRDFKATDLVSFHMSGYGYITPGGGVNNPGEERPLRGPGRQADFMAGLTGAIATMFAVFAARAAGEGQYVDVSELEAMSSASLGVTGGYLFNKVPASRMKYGMSGSLAHLPTTTGLVCPVFIEEDQWSRWVEMMGSPDWARPEVFRSKEQRSANWDIIEPLMAEWTKDRTKDEITRMAHERGIPCSPINTIEDVVNSEQMAEREFFVDVEHPSAGKVSYPGAPYKLSASPWRVSRPAPLLGEHNEEVLVGRLGYNKEELVRLRGMGVI